VIRRAISSRFQDFYRSREKREKESEGTRYVAERRAEEALRFETVRLKCQTAIGEIFISLITASRKNTEVAFGEAFFPSFPVKEKFLPRSR
jgi:hypothetical protein